MLDFTCDLKELKQILSITPEWGGSALMFESDSEGVFVIIKYTHHINPHNNEQNTTTIKYKLCSANPTKGDIRWCTTSIDNIKKALKAFKDCKTITVLGTANKMYSNGTSCTVALGGGYTHYNIDAITTPTCKATINNKLFIQYVTQLNYLNCDDGRLRSMACDFTGNVLKFVRTDGHALTQIDADTEQLICIKENLTLIPSSVCKFMLGISKWLDHKKSFNICCDDNATYIATDGLQIKFNRISDERTYYPAYNKVFNVGGLELKTTFNTKQPIQILKKAGAVGEVCEIEFNNPKGLSIYTDNKSTALKQNVICEVKGNKYISQFTIKYLQNTLQSIGDNMYITCYVASADDPLIIESKNIKSCIMPYYGHVFHRDSER